MRQLARPGPREGLAACRPVPAVGSCSGVLVSVCLPSKVEDGERGVRFAVAWGYSVWSVLQLSGWNKINVDTKFCAISLKFTS